MHSVVLVSSLPYTTFLAVRGGLMSSVIMLNLGFYQMLPVIMSV